MTGRRVQINRMTEQRIKNIQVFYTKEFGITLTAHEAIKVLLKEFERGGFKTKK